MVLGEAAGQTEVVPEHVEFIPVGASGCSYGACFREAVRQAAGPVITMLGDGTHNPQFIRALHTARWRADIVVGSRFTRFGYTPMPLARRLKTRWLNRLFARVAALPVRDLTSEFRLYQAGVLRSVHLAAEDHTIHLEVLVQAAIDGFSMVEVPYHQSAPPDRLWAPGMRWGGTLRLLKKFWRMRNDYNAADYDERAFNSWLPPQRIWQRSRYRLALSMIPRQGRTLDIGCGSGKILEALPLAVGLDINLRKLRFRKPLGLPLVNASIFRLPFIDESFDEVVASEVIEHVAADEHLFAEINRVLRPGGVAVVSTPDYGGFWWPVIERVYKIIVPIGYADDHITHYTAGSLRAKLERANFRVLEQRHLFKAIVFLKARKADRTP